MEFLILALPTPTFSRRSVWSAARCEGTASNDIELGIILDYYGARGIHSKENRGHRRAAPRRCPEALSTAMGLSTSCPKRPQRYVRIPAAGLRIRPEDVAWRRELDLFPSRLARVIDPVSLRSNAREAIRPRSRAMFGRRPVRRELRQFRQLAPVR